MRHGNIRKNKKKKIRRIRRNFRIRKRSCPALHSLHRKKGAAEEGGNACGDAVTGRQPEAKKKTRRLADVLSVDILSGQARDVPG